MFFSGLDIRAQRNPNFVREERYLTLYDAAGPTDAPMKDVKSFLLARSQNRSRRRAACVSAGELRAGMRERFDSRSRVPPVRPKCFPHGFVFRPARCDSAADSASQKSPQGA
jgi:hypothetical protein